MTKLEKLCGAVLLLSTMASLSAIIYFGAKSEPTQCNDEASVVISHLATKFAGGCK